MRILYIVNEALMGGLQRHVLCLMESLKDIAEVAVVFNVRKDDSTIRMFERAGLKVYWLEGRGGCDWRSIGRLRRVLKDFNPDVVHVHALSFFCALWLRFLIHVPVIHSIHTPPRKPQGKGLLKRFVFDRLVDYWLPVSAWTWAEFKKWHPRANGEVFFNPIRIGKREEGTGNGKRSDDYIVGMVGRNADAKDWPSFHKVESLIQARLSQEVIAKPHPHRRRDVLVASEQGRFSSLSTRRGRRVHSFAIDSQFKSTNPPYTCTSDLRLSFLNAGEREVCDGQKAIAKMDLFVMTSKHEQLPTTMLECFVLGTPICGFIPAGGVREVLAFSSGPVRNAFIETRDCGKLADLVVELLRDEDRRRRIVEDGRRIVEEHFDAEKNCRGQLMAIYRKVIAPQIELGLK